jgi:long-chain acyl-CoA synthetase
MEGEMKERHLAQMVLNRAKQYSTKIALRAKAGGTWEDISYKSLGEQVEAVGKALLEMGVKEGERVGIFSQNRPEWTIADYGILATRAVSVPIYATNAAKQAEYIVNDAEIRILFVGAQDQYDKIKSFSDGSPYLKTIIAFDEGVKLDDRPSSIYFRDLLKGGRKSGKELELDGRLTNGSTDDLATLIYTSGTTGEPKGVMLNHSNFCHSFFAHDKRLDVSEKDVSLCFLPLTHVFERAWSYFVIRNGMTNVYVDDTSKVIEYLQEVKPTIMCAVPRFYEKFYSGVFEKLETAPAGKRRIFFWAVKVGEEVFLREKEENPVPPLLRLKHGIANALVLKKIRAVVGGRIRFFPCAGAPLSQKIEEFFHAVGITIKYGYGLTETTATVTCHDRYHFKPGTVGKPIDGVEVKIAPNGEILVKGKTVTKGYYKKPEATAEAFEGDWFKTGDVGVLEAGLLTITDRIKDLMKTSGGKYIAPQYVETTVGKDHFIEQIIAIGDRRPFVTALIVPSFAPLDEFSKSRNTLFSSHEEMVKNPMIIEFYQKRIDEQQKELAGFERIKRFTLLPRPFTQEAGEITPTLKVKRKAILEKYGDLIDAMYR